MPTTPIDLIPYLSAGATANISGGESIGLNSINGVSEIPSFVGTEGIATITITPVKDGCVGLPVTLEYNVINCNLIVNINVLRSETTYHTNRLALESIIIGGLAPYTYNWLINNSTFNTSNDLPPFQIDGIYDLTVTDSLGNTAFTTETINNVLGIDLLTNYNIGTYVLTITPLSGVAPYTYIWDDFTITTSNTRNILPNQGYCVFVFDFNGLCSYVTASSTRVFGYTDFIISYYIYRSSDIISGVQYNHAVSIYIDKDSSNISETHTYLWNDGNTASARLLPVGIYTCDVTGSLGLTKQVTIDVPLLPIIDINITTTNSSGSLANGSVIINNVTNMTNPLSIFLYDVLKTSYVTNYNSLLAGNYTIYVNDYYSVQCKKDFTIL